MQDMMEKAKRFTTPGPAHKELERFLGSWETGTRFVMQGKRGDPEKGTAEGRWLMKGRWLVLEGQGTLMGRPHRWHTIMGYDNFKQSYVVTTVSSMDTAMLRSEGDMLPDGSALITYGTLDEYLTGEHDKMVKYVWRFSSKERMLFEVHDLPIGETGTKVVEVVFTRKD